MRHKIETALQPLVGKNLWGSGRAGDVQWFHFDDPNAVPARAGVKQVGEYAIHVTCSWRIVDAGQIVVASRDRYYPTGDPWEEEPGFKWDVVGANRCDARTSEFLSTNYGRLKVGSITVDDVGSLSIGLSETARLDVFPDDSLESEYWRLFRPGEDEQHFVVTGSGIED